MYGKVTFSFSLRQQDWRSQGDLDCSNDAENWYRATSLCVDWDPRRILKIFDFENIFCLFEVGGDLLENDWIFDDFIKGNQWKPIEILLKIFSFRLHFSQTSSVPKIFWKIEFLKILRGSQTTHNEVVLYQFLAPLDHSKSICDPQTCCRNGEENVTFR